MRFVFVQFHAEPMELIKIVFDLANVFDLNCFCADTTNNRLLGSYSDFFNNYNEEYKGVEFLLVLFESNQRHEINTVVDLKNLRKTGVYIEVGALKEDGLMESAISFSKSEVQFKALDPIKIITHFKKFTKAGVISFNVKTGAEGTSKSHRYTERAKALYDSGVKIIPFGGGKTVFYKLP